jgi:hypothetical protein
MSGSRSAVLGSRSTNDVALWLSATTPSTTNYLIDGDNAGNVYANASQSGLIFCGLNNSFALTWDNTTLASSTGTSDFKYYKLSGKLTASTTAPTISSGFGTNASIPANNGTLAFTVNVGTGGTASSGVIGLSTTTTAWVCECDDLAAAVGATETRMSATSITTCTVTNVNTATGVAAAWASSEVLYCTAHPL